MRSLIFLLILAAGCKSSPPPEKTPPGGSAACAAPQPGVAMTQEQCTCLGGRVNLSRGGEQAHCATHEQELGTVRFGIEGGWCCKPASPASGPDLP